MSELQLRPLSTYEHPQMTSQQHWEFEPPSVLIWDGERLGEAVPYYQEDWDNDDDWSTIPPIIFKEWRWANHGSCDCCWSSISNPIAWAPFPSKDDVPHCFRPNEETQTYG